MLSTKIFLFFKKTRWLVVFCLILFILGFLRGGFALNKLSDNRLQNFYGQEIIFKGEVLKEPEISQERQELVLEIEEFEEKILVYTPPYPQYQYGDRLEISGKVEEPPVFDDFDYKAYLSYKGIYGVMFSPEIVYQRSTGNWLYKKILAIKSELRESIYRSFPSKQKLLLGAMILGDKSRLTDDLKEVLNNAGLRHLTAISGMHITILVNLLMLFFLGLGLWRKQAFWLTAVFILFFLVLTGFQASTIRASIMGFLFLLGQNLGRKGDSLRAILLAASLMLVFNPFLLAEAGFQLSFLAVLGINYLFPIFSSWLRKIPNSFQIRNILAMSLAAQIFTLPILIYNFGYISLVAPITNILVLPFLPFIIALGFLAALLGIFSQYLALIFVFPCFLLLSYLLKIAEIFSSFSFSSIYLKISWLWLIVFYLVLGFLIWRWRRENRFRILGF